LREPLGGRRNPAAFLRFKGRVAEASRWHHLCKFVANKRKSQIEIHLADAILH